MTSKIWVLGFLFALTLLAIATLAAWLIGDVNRADGWLLGMLTFVACTAYVRAFTK